MGRRVRAARADLVMGRIGRLLDCRKAVKLLGRSSAHLELFVRVLWRGPR
jgi:hypothetical protein